MSHGLRGVCRRGSLSQWYYMSQAASGTKGGSACHRGFGVYVAGAHYHKGGSACHRSLRVTRGVVHVTGRVVTRRVVHITGASCHKDVVHVTMGWLMSRVPLGRQVLWADRHRTDRCDNLVFRIGSGMGCIGKIRLDCLTWDGPVAQCALPSPARASTLRSCGVSELRCCAFSSFWGHPFIEPCSL